MKESTHLLKRENLFGPITNYSMKSIKTVGVVGAGTMGAALAQKFAQEGFNVILADRSMEFVDRGIGNINTVLQEGVERKVFTSQQVSSFLKSLTGTDKLEMLSTCDLVVEAIFENFDAKKDLFKSLNAIVSDECILATNTSSFSVSELSKVVQLPERFIGLHFFFHAAKNRLVEIVPGNSTNAETIADVKRFAVLAGKDAIMCADSYGFVVNRFFVPWLNESVRLLQEGVASREEIDQVCQNVFGIGMGPFALMNATGVPVAYHAEKTLEVFGSLYHVAEALRLQAECGEIWPLTEKIDMVVPAEKVVVIRERMLGVVFFVCSQLIEERVCSATEIDRGAKIGLRWRKGPVELMKGSGIKEVARIIGLIATRYGMKLPTAVGDKFWEMRSVNLECNGNVAVIRMDEPESMNALSEQTMVQLEECFDKAESDADVKTIFITGSGKAFVAGADIKFFVQNIKKDRISEIEAFTSYGQRIFEKIDHSKKRVVAIVNGLALGGGLELALCADDILATPKAQFAFPETSIGIYPGLGGTQRSVRKVGIGISKYMIYTGKMLNTNEALEVGLIDNVITNEEMFFILEGKMQIPTPIDFRTNESWKHISDFCSSNSLSRLMGGTYDLNGLSREDADKLIKVISRKAPVALRLAEQLITEHKGCSSELEHLNEIFHTSDAILGLTSIGKKVEFSGT